MKVGILVSQTSRSVSVCRDGEGGCVCYPHLAVGLAVGQHSGGNFDGRIHRKICGATIPFVAAGHGDQAGYKPEGEQ